MEAFRESGELTCTTTHPPWWGSSLGAFVIAEVGVNHQGSVDTALALIDAAQASGADSVKFQTFQAELLASKSAPQATYQRRSEGDAPSSGQLEMLRSLELSEKAFRRIKKHCDRTGIEFLSTPFDIPSARFLGDLGVKRFKVGSGDLTNLPLLRTIGSHGLPVILSTGMARDEEMEEAIQTLESAGASEVTILHCISRYPTPPEDLQLLQIVRLRELFGRPVGFSDHSLGFEAALGARSLGAVVLEKHLTLDRGLPGPDHAASSTPEELEELIRRLRTLETMLGSEQRTFHPEEEEIREVARKSIVALRPIGCGDLLEEENLGVLRPGTGIAPRHWEDIVGRRAARDIPRGEPLQWSMVK